MYTLDTRMIPKNRRIASYYAINPGGPILYNTPNLTLRTLDAVRLVYNFVGRNNIASDATEVCSRITFENKHSADYARATGRPVTRRNNTIIITYYCVFGGKILDGIIFEYNIVVCVNRVRGLYTRRETRSARVQAETFSFFSPSPDSGKTLLKSIWNKYSNT